MTINPFFNLYKNRQEQSLVEDLINESINMLGFDAYYIPNSNEESRDLFYGDDPLKQFDDAYVITAYLSNSVDPGMNNDFFSKFGLEIKNNVRIQLPRREFAKKVPQEEYSRPQEGHLVYIPFLSGTGELYEIKYVNDSSDFFTLGRKAPYYWELELELFKYSNELVDTGIEEIDVIEKDSAYVLQLNLRDGTGNYEINEVVYQSPDLVLANATAKASVVDWDGTNLILSVSNISGTFSNDDEIVGNHSEATYFLESYDPLNQSTKKDSFDNSIIETESDKFIVSDEENPFGTLGF